MMLPVTMTFAAVAVLINMWLAVRIGRVRIADKTLHGDGGNAMLARRIRAHSNFIEYTPLVLILCGLVEMARGSAIWLWAIMLIYSFGRVAHGFGMDSDQPGPARGGGIMVTFATMLVLVGVALYSVYTYPA